MTISWNFRTYAAPFSTLHISRLDNDAADAKEETEVAAIINHAFVIHGRKWSGHTHSTCTAKIKLCQEYVHCSSKLNGLDLKISAHLHHFDKLQ